MNWLKETMVVFRTGLGRKLALPVILALALVSVPFFFAFHYEQVVDTTAADVANRDDAISHVNDMDAAVKTQQVLAFEMILGGRLDVVGEFQAAAADAQFWLDQAREHADDSVEIAGIGEAQSLQDRTQSIVLSQVVPALESSPADGAALEAIEGELQASYERMDDLHNQVESSFVEEREAALVSRVASRGLASELIWGSAIAALLLGLSVAIYFSKKLILPVQGIAEASLKVARGDLSRRVEVRGHDELADMGRSFNDMADSLERRTEQLEREKARIRSIHQSIGDGLIVVDRAGVIMSVNPAAERILRRTATQLERTTNTGIPELQAALLRKISPEEMVACWEAKDCAKTDCPSHGSDDHRCWLQCGTFCYNQIQGTFKQKRDACERCDVFISNAVQELTLEIGDKRYSTSIVPILDDEGQEEGRSVAMHDVTDVLQAKESLEHRGAELATINSVSETLSESLDLKTTLLNAIEKILQLTKGDAATVHLLDESGDFLQLVAAKGFTQEIRAKVGRIPRNSGMAWSAITAGETVRVDDTSEDERVLPQVRNSGYLSALSIPLKAKGKIIGAITLPARERAAYSDDDVRLLTLIAKQIALAVEKSMLYEDSLKLSRQALAKNRIVSTLASTMDLRSVFDVFADEVEHLVDFHRISVATLDDDAEIMSLYLPVGMAPAVPVGEDSKRSPKGTAVEWVAQNRKPFISGAIGEEIRFKEQATLVSEGMRSMLVLPLIVKGKVLGSLNFASKRAAAYSDGTIREMRPVADQLAMALANQKLFDDVTRAKSEWEKTFDSASEGIAMIGMDHRITRLNKAAANMMGGSVEQFIGRKCHEVIHQTGSMPVTCLMHDAIHSGTTTRGEQELADGRTLEVVVDAIFDDTGAPAGTAHFLRDITEAKRLRQQLVQSEKMIAVGQLVAGVAHEINNPLTGVMGYAQLLLARNVDDQTREDAQGIYRDAERATRIVRHLLSFARKHQPERNLIDINAVLRETIELKAYELRVNNVSVESDLDVGLPMTIADPHQLQQVFLNLINNAEHAMLETDRSGILRVSTRRMDGHIRIVFSDTGPGIPVEEIDRVFDPFYTTKEIGKGTGLGLSVCFGVVQDHGGAIWVEPAQGAGATVIVELPVVQACPVDSRIEKEKTRKRLGKILLVDDEASIREVLTQTLEKAGHDVESVPDGAAALQLLKEKHYDCVVSDVKMPVMDGPTLHLAVREMDPEVARSFIFISGDSVSPETRSYLEDIDNPRLAKPFSLSELEQALQKMLAACEGRDD